MLYVTIYFLHLHYFRIPICPPSPSETEAKTDHHSSPVPKMKCKDSVPTPGLQKCFDPRCSERNSSQTCEGVVGCYWCKNDKDDLPLKQPYCASSELCFRGREGILFDPKETLASIRPFWHTRSITLRIMIHPFLHFLHITLASCFVDYFFGIARVIR